VGAEVSCELTEENGVVPKILSPIKSIDECVRVIHAGADELYCGVTIPRVKEFVLYRGMGCDVHTYDEFEEIVSYAHKHDVRVFVTVNQPFMVNMIDKPMRAHIRSCIDRGADALIVGDLGVMSLIRNTGLDIPIYASTYMASMNLGAVDFLREMGFSRVVLERHLLLNEIAQIVKRSKLDVEVFIHGAGCSNINGLCYLYHYDFPSLIQAKSEICGAKVPCRIPFEIYDVRERDRMLDSAPILDWFEFCALCRLPELMKVGVKGFKIEGREMNSWYKESTTKIYRELIDRLSDGRVNDFWSRLRSLKNSFYPLPPIVTNLQETLCDQERCYYGPLFHVPYKQTLSPQVWTKSQFSYWSVLR
jgi:putative protease